jgi:hypothetical protein
LFATVFVPRCHPKLIRAFNEAGNWNYLKPRPLLERFLH